MKTTILTSTFAALFILPATSAVVGHTFTGVTVVNFSQPADLITEFPVGTRWSLRVEWDDAAAPLFVGATQSQFPLTKLTLTLQGKSGPWTTSSVAGEATFSLSQLGASDSIQFSSGWGAGDHTNQTLGAYKPQSVNLTLEDSTGNAFDNLTPAPSAIDMTKWNPSASNFKFYVSESGFQYILGEIDLIDTTPLPEISVKPPKGAEFVDGKSAVGFGKAKAGKKGVTKTFVIRNTGKAPLTQLEVELSGPGKRDYIVGKLKKGKLAPGASTTVKATFAPRENGVRNAVLKIRSNDADENPFDIRLTGTGRGA